jgi:hypothetical protein
LIEAFDRLWTQARPAFGQQRTWRRARSLTLGALLGLGRRTVSGLLSATGQQFADWSAAYRLFAHERFDPHALLAPSRRAVAESLSPQAPLVALMDDTLARKRGRKVAGTSWRRDPLGPHFCTNLVWGQRFLQISAALPERPGASRARAIPIDLTHCPSPRKPRKGAPAAQWAQYQRDQQASRISTRGAERIAQLRQALDRDGQAQRPLIVAVDGGYTNTAVFKALPERTALIGRVRKDAKLYRPPSPPPEDQRGRKRVYGEPLPTPEQLRQDETLPWQTVRAFAAGRLFDFEVKAVGAVRWRAAGARDLRLVIIRPLAYRLSQGGRLLYREPAYLLCSDPQLDLAQLVQAYLWRWEIEVNFRDQKTLLGMGQAQVRTAGAVERVPALIAAAYGFLHLALAQTGAQDGTLPRPRWQRPKPGERCSSARAIGLLRAQLWGRALGVENFSHFVENQQALTKSQKFIPHPASAIFYAST